MNQSLKEQVEREIKENLKKEKLLQQQTRLAQMGEMISMIAHQWRQPLNAISSSIAIIQIKMARNRFDLDKKDEREQFLSFLEEKHNSISNYTENLSETIDDFRNFFKPDRQKNKISLTRPIKKALSIVKPSMVNKGIEINTSYKVDTKIKMYKNELMQVILNILKNAEDNFKEKGIKKGKIDISTSKENGTYIIKICDNGGGIEQDIMPKIFDPYFSTKDEKNGTGLGLYIAKIIVEEHNGGILEVKNSKNGACFIIRLFAS
ncbi:MAG: HAMP domain-containing histidine kinase [Epsilonproteobacteria bacterium]|nr:HAMP domain-containing histidine kinase [Campylobacterota bacterium]